MPTESNITDRELNCSEPKIQNLVTKVLNSKNSFSCNDLNSYTDAETALVFDIIASKRGLIDLNASSSLTAKDAILHFRKRYIENDSSDEIILDLISSISKRIAMSKCA